ncbi:MULTISPECIES: dihydrofolate reductase family protein [unclassified Saccharothrix]|uniref:dihydrofolate reductase family protein n=1 Tax=unclassified Saccharothrix TaxID=2593673 RepID=UPI00307D5E88
MRNLTYLVAMSLDGFIAAPDGTYADFLFEGDHMAALFEEYPDALPTAARQALGLDDVPNRTFDTVLMGRATYEVPGGLPSPYAHLRQYVVSSTLTGTPSDVTVISDDVVTAVRELKAESGLDIWLCGGGKLAATLASEIDKLVLKVHPIVLGRGVPLFDGEFPVHRFAKIETRTFATGVAFTTYTRS